MTSSRRSMKPCARIWWNRHRSGPGWFDFPHALVREALSGGMGTPERLRGHRRIAQALEGGGAGDEPGQARLGELAWHWLQAGDGRRAIRYATAAGDEASRQLAYEEAARLNRVALGQAEGSRMDAATRTDLLLRVVTSEYRSGNVRTAMEAFVEAAELARRSHRSDLLADAPLIVQGIGDPEVNASVLRACDAILADDAGMDDAVRARLQAQRSVALCESGRMDDALPDSDRALQLAEGSADPSLVAAILPARHLALAGPDWPFERLALAERGLELARSLDAPMEEMWARVWRTDAFWELGDVGAVDAEIERLAGLSHSLRNPIVRWHVKRFRAARALMEGRFTDAAELSEEATAEVPSENFMARVLHVTLMAAIDADVGAFTWMHANRWLVEARHSILSLTTMAWTLLSAARRDEALVYYERARGSAGRVPRDARWMITTVLLTHLSFELDDRDTAAVCHRELIPYRDRFSASGGGTVACQGSIELFLGMAATTLGLVDEAEGHLRRAIDRNAAAGARPWKARAELTLAELLRRRGASPRRTALDLAERAANTARALGMRVLLASAEALVTELTSASGPLALSPREREVATLVTRGLSNREIARTLYLSERTAENHVQHILTKLGFDSRAQIAAWAVAEGLASTDGN